MPSFEKKNAKARPCTKLIFKIKKLQNLSVLLLWLYGFNFSFVANIALKCHCIAEESDFFFSIRNGKLNLNFCVKINDSGLVQNSPFWIRNCNSKCMKTAYSYISVLCLIELLCIQFCLWQVLLEMLNKTKSLIIWLN